MINLSYVCTSLDTSQHPSSQVYGGTKLAPLQFLLVVRDFGIKYERQEEITNILDALKKIYKISEDWDGKLYCGLNLK